MGVANQRSIAMSCLNSFVQKGDWDVILTVQNDSARSKVRKIIESRFPVTNEGSRILGEFVCDVTDPKSTDLFFHELLPETLDKEKQSLQAVIHSIAFAPNLRKPLLFTSQEEFLQAHEISSYSLIQVARESIPYLGTHGENDGVERSPSITTLSYLGADRAIPGYHSMGPAKASLESTVRGLALELGQHRTTCGPLVRVNAIRAGPIPTLSSKGGISGFDRMRQDVHQKAPLGNISACQVATTVYHVAAEADGMTGQTIEVDGGYSIVAGPLPTEADTK